MSIREDIIKGRFFRKESCKESNGLTWFYSYNPANGFAIICPEEVIFTKRSLYGMVMHSHTVKPAVNPVPKDVLKVPESLNGHRIIGIDSYSFSKTAEQAIDWINQQVYSTVVIPSSIQYIGSGAFEKCDRITDISGGLQAEEIGGFAFQDCKSLSKVEFLPGTKVIGMYAFSGCTNLQRVWFSEGITTIDTCAFSKCPKLMPIDLPESIEQIAEDAFSESTNKITYSEKLGFWFPPSLRGWRMRTNNSLKRRMFDLLH